MNDPDVIAYLFAADGVKNNCAIDVINLAQNQHLVVAPRKRKPKKLAAPPPPQEADLDRCARGATEQPEEKENEEETEDIIPHEGAYLRLLFSKPPKTPNGLRRGRSSPDVDILVPEYRGVSRLHFALTFDSQNRLIIRDLKSTIGTRVLYGDSDEDAQRGFGADFSARGPALVGDRPPIIKILGDLQFKLVVPHHDITSSAYLERVARFREGTAEAGDLFADLALLSRRTATELPTPALERFTRGAEDVPGKILWMKELGRGSFALVKYAWDVKTTKVYALKTPLPSKKYDRKQWRREAEILKDLRHVRNLPSPSLPQYGRRWTT